MFITELAIAKQVKVIYPGRFQPPHKGHAKVYEYLCQKFGADNVYIVTSNKVALPKSPFNFVEKQKMWALTGVNTDRVLMDPQPYRAEKIIAQWDPSSTILLFAVSEKDMAEDPRFQFKPKKDGSPSYFQPFTDLTQCQTLDKHAYMMTVPTFDFTVLGKPANSASQIRAEFIGAPINTQRKIVTDLFGKFNSNVFNLVKSRLEDGAVVTEDDSDEIAKNISSHTGRSHEEAQAIIRAARTNALKIHGGNEQSPGFDAKWKSIAARKAFAPKGQEHLVMSKDNLPEDRVTPAKPPKKGSQRWLSMQKRKEYDKAHPPVEPADQMYGTAKILPKKTEEGRLPQLSTYGADYSKFDTDHLKSMLRPGVMHRNELKFKTLIRRELRKREKEKVTELSPATHASHIEKRSPQVIPTLMKDLKKGAKMGRAVSKSIEKVKAFNNKKQANDGEPNVFEGDEFNPQDVVKLDIPLMIRMLEYAREDAKTDLDLHNVVERLIQMSTDGKTLGMDEYNSIVSKQVQEAVANFKRSLTESTEADILNPNPKIASLAAAVVRMKKELHALTGNPESIEEGWGKKTAAALAAAAAIGSVGCSTDEPSVACRNIEKKMQGTPMQRAGVMANPTTRNMQAGCNIKKKLTKETIVPGFGEMRPEQVQKEVEGLTAEMLKYARDGNMRAVNEYIKKLQPFVDTARKGEITESIDKALRTAKRNAV